MKSKIEKNLIEAKTRTKDLKRKIDRADKGGEKITPNDIEVIVKTIDNLIDALTEINKKDK